MKVIIAIDDSLYSNDMVDELAARRWPRDTEFKVLRVIEPVSWAELSKGKWADVVANAHILRHEDAQKLCARARAKFEHSVADCTVHFEIREGNAKAEILDAAVEWSADKIMLGAHGHNVCPRFILGSVSRSIAAHAPCSVEIIRCKKTHAKASQSAQKVSAGKPA